VEQVYCIQKQRQDAISIKQEKVALTRAPAFNPGAITALMRIMKFLIAVTAVIALLTTGLAMAQTYPVCNSHLSDPDGDGYGWENGTCLVERVNHINHSLGPQAQDTDSVNECIDTVPLNDGWGWNGHSSCKVEASPNITAKKLLDDQTAHVGRESGDWVNTICIDTTPLNDGWGWDGEKSCRVSSVDINDNRTPFQRHGKLSICKRDSYMLCDQFGQAVQLTGMSSHGIHWSGWHTYDRNGCLTEDSLNLLAQSWGTEIFRIAMYIKNGGYETNPEETIRHVNTIISELSERGMYAIVDFHILAGTGISGNPLDYLNTAETFFRRIVRDNAHRQNVLYEIANEPQGSNLNWDHISQYADKIIRVIRDAEQPDNHAVVIVGTNSWSSFGMAGDGNYFDIVHNPVHDSAQNLMYAFHFYAGDSNHISKGYRDALATAVYHFPVFVTEWGTQSASGGGNNDFNRAREYVQLMREKKISWTMWNFSDSEESSAVWNETSFCGRNQGWNDPANLSATGRFISDIFQAQ
jgi:endoglucanase